MRFTSRCWKRLGIVLAITTVVVISVRFWVVPALILGQIQSRLVGKATIRGFWLDGHSAGVIGLTVHEGPAAGSPVWATVDRVATDLSIGRLLRGRFSPGRVELRRPRVQFRLDRAGRVVNIPQIRARREREGPFPDVSIGDAEVTFRREGRAEAMVVNGVEARLEPEKRGGSLTLSARSHDPNWGRWRASGSMDPGTGQGDIKLAGKQVVAEPHKLERIPFVPEQVWTHVAPTGPVDVEVAFHWDRPAGFHARTEVTFLETSATFGSLGFDAIGTTGRLQVEDGLVRLESISGRAMDGRVDARGTLDFRRSPSRIDLDLGLKGVNVTEVPKAWQLGEVGITGRLTGTVALRAVLEPGGVDLSGSSGEGVVEGGSLQGIPFQTLRLAMRARGNDLHYETPAPAASRGAAVVRGLVAALPIFLRGGPSRSRLALELFAAEDMVALQAPAAKEKARPQAAAKGPRLPESISTHIEFKDVDIALIVAKAQYFLGMPFPLPVAGRLSMKADVTIPLGTLRDPRRYVFHGQATLTGASIDKIDFGRLTTLIDMVDGVLELTDLRGRLVDHPNGGPDNPPRPTAPSVTAKGPLPPGGFRGRVRVPLSPPGVLAVHLEGHLLPLGELAAPALPRPTPLDGRASLEVEASANLGDIRNPAAWTAAGKADSDRIVFHGASLDGVAFRFTLRDGRLEIPTLAAALLGRALSGRANLDLKAPRSFNGRVDVAGWDLAAVEALVPGAPRPSPVGGALTAHAEAKGTLSPWSIETSGRGEIAGFQARSIGLGDVPFRWTTAGEAIEVSVIDARPFGGRLSAEAWVPIAAGPPIRGSATITGLDAAALAAALPGRSIQLAGKTDGKVVFILPADSRALEAKIDLRSQDLTIQKLPAEHLEATLRRHQGGLRYEATAESLGGRVKFVGDFPLTASASAPNRAANGELRVVGFTLPKVWGALGVSVVLSKLGGLGALDANLRDYPAGVDQGLWAHGIVELRDLSWSQRFPLGRLRGTVVKTPDSWRVEPLSGELLGGQASGLLWGKTAGAGKDRLGFNVRIDRASLRGILAPWPLLAQNIDGFGTLRMVGSMGEFLRTQAEVSVSQARVAGLPMAELRVPAELIYSPSRSSGTVTLRRGSARLAGGQVRGDLAFRFGEERGFQGQVQLSSLDLETLVRLESDSRRPATGRLSGRIALSSPDPALLMRYRGKVLLDLDDASLVAVPVLREIERFLGTAGGGLFEDGDLVGTIINKQLVVEMLTLEGRLVQLHGTGTVGFDTQVNLEVLVNTNQIISQTGQALVNLVPGLRDVLGSGQQARRRVGNFLSSRLLKLRVGGTLRNPTVTVDPAIAVADSAVTFFSGVLELPLGFLR